MRTSLCGWPHVIANCGLIVNLSGGLDTIWAALTQVVANQTNKPELPKHPAKLVFDPHSTIGPFLKKIGDHVTSAKYGYASPEHARILRHVEPEGSEQGLEALRKELLGILPYL
jgi:hypothetical protein